MGFTFGGSSDFGLVFGCDVGPDSICSSSLRSDHCVLFLGTVSLGTAVALDGNAAPGGDNTFGAVLVSGKLTAFAITAFGDAAFGA